MSDLEQLQDEMQQFLLSGHSSINRSVVVTESVSVATRLDIYRDAYRLRLIESLTTSYPALHAYLGTEEFETMCGEYIKAHPSVFRSIRWYGHAINDFLRQYYAESCSYLVELAHFEWNMTLVFDAADAAVISMQEMAVVAPESWAGMHFLIHPSLRRVNYFWNTIPLWNHLIADLELPPLNKETQAVAWVLWRTFDYQIRFYSMSEEEAWMLDALIQGLTFGELCEGLCQWVDVDSVGMHAASYLKNWIQNGMLSRLMIASKP